MKLRILFFITAWGAMLPANAQSPLVVGLISTESTNQLKEAWVPVIEALSARTGLEAKPFFATDYAGIVEAMRFNKVHVAWMGNKAAIEAVDRAGAEVFLQQVDNTGDNGYYSHLVVHRDSPLQNIEQMFQQGQSLVFGIGDVNSTSGYLVPYYHVFALHKKTPKDVFKAVRVSNHEGHLMAVAAGQVDVATNNSENLRRFGNKFPEKAALVRVIWTSPLLASDPMVWRKDLPQDTKDKVNAFFLAYGKEGPDAAKEAEILSKFLLKGFKESDNSQLIPVRKLELFKDKMTIEADEGMTAEAKAQALAEIDAKLAALEEKAP